MALFLAVILGSLKLVPLSIAFLLAGLAVIVLKCITVEEVYSFIEWRLIILIGGMTYFGLAMDRTQTADYLAQVMDPTFRSLFCSGRVCSTNHATYSTNVQCRCDP